MSEFDLSSAQPVRPSFDWDSAVPVSGINAQNPHAGMTHQTSVPPVNPVGNAVQQWGRGVAERSTPAGFAKSFKQNIDELGTPEGALNLIGVGTFIGKG